MYEVAPSATTLTTRNGSVFVTKVANLVASLVKQLCGERTCTYTCAISLHDAIDIANTVRTNAQSDAGTGADGVRRSNERIRSEVNVEHSALGTLTENVLA